MGTALSRFRLALRSFRAVTAAYEELNNRIQQSPGIPAPDPTTSYWAIPASPIARHGSDATLPAYADVVIIGSGITGTAFARTLLGFTYKNAGVVDSPQIVMLEARDACSGATGRNGGHITPDLYHDYGDLKEAYGTESAQAIIRFRLSHLDELIQVSKDEELLEDGQCRKVETFDVFFDQESFRTASRNLAIYLDEMPDQLKLWRIVGADERKVFAVAVSPLSVADHAHSFCLFTHTPCLSISSPASPKTSEQLYTVCTKKGNIQARHVVHATNAWASNLLPTMRRKIVPVRAHMTAQRPGMGLGRKPPLEKTPPKLANHSVLTLIDNAEGASESWLGTRSFVLYSGGKYDYLTQQPATSAASSLYPPPAAEFMFGGGLSRGQAMEYELGVADDRAWSLDTAAYLGGALSLYFSGWGAEGRDGKCAESLADSDIEAGRVKKIWTGIFGMSADGCPWVGRLPAKIAGRPMPRPSPSIPRLAAPGEWISAGYSGEGMVLAFLSGKALAYMVLGSAEEVPLPGPLLITEARWKEANIENLVTSVLV
ncbi:hypothetical protein GGX14DRAFT_424682 [Mycena pura]|uniref:FAD dependent oxidoreductase domain-containing protein n=1 Tax=Mycena pura TaxID=153505 RepID=A0AAD7E1T8_9AGAR|nr:hypothetical protein GGX14DRAFT_424682 [Mycena pura]